MPWFKVDDHFWSHPKVNDLSPSAVALWVRAGSFAAQHLTDGDVGAGTIKMLGYKRDAANELVNAGLWDAKDEKTWTFHDWAKYQPSKETVTAEREAARQRMREVRANRPRSSATPSRPGPVPDMTYVSESSPLDNRATDDSETTRQEQTARGVLEGGFNINPDRLIAHIRQRCDRAVTVAEAMRVATFLLDKGRDVKNPQGYVLTSITQSWAEVQKYIDEGKP